jgi:radical SAM superfamily enzyme YgiQ (UPF0313 family)
MKILFVATKKNQHEGDRELYEMPFLNGLFGFKRSLFDLGIVTVAALTPRDVEVEYLDEYLEDVPYDTDADLVALSAKTSCAPHAYRVAERFRARGKKVVLGGIHASLLPDEALEHVDHVVIGEAEKTWPRFVELFREGKAPRVMNDEGFAPMEDIPVPRWDLLPHKDYLFHQVQTTRGCPFMCRFCSVPDISGNQFRFKPIANLVKEVLALPSAGITRDPVKTLYVVDDNFLSRVRYTKDLLREWIPLRRAGKLPDWSAETTVNVALDEELLGLLKEAGCTTLIIGFESISEQTLLSMDKKVNFSISYKDALERIHAHGIGVMANFIIGFDTDTIEVFGDLMKFIDDNNILYPFFSILTPMPGTKLYDDYEADGRLDHTDWERYDTRHVVYEPKHMTREQLLDGYCWLFAESYASDRGLDRLGRYWRTVDGRRSNAAEKSYVFWLLRKQWRKGSKNFQRMLREGTKRAAKPGSRADVGHLLYYWDSAHFAEYLTRYRSVEYARHERIFRGQEAAPAAPDRAPADQLVELQTKQWDSARSKKRARRATA